MSGAGDRVIFSVMECSGSRQRWLHTSENTPPVSEQSTLPGCQYREDPRSTRTATEPPARRSPPQGGTRGSGALRCAQAWCPAASVQAHGPMRPGSWPPHLLAASLLLALVSLLWLLVLLLQGSGSGARPWLFLQEAQWWGFGGHLGLGRSVPCLCAGTPAERRAPGLRQHATCRVSKQEVKCRWPAERGGDPAWGRRALTAEPRAQSGRAHRPPRRDYSRLLPGSATRARCSVATWARPGAQELAQT